MASVNKAIILGNLGKDPDIRYLPNGDAVANFSVATTESWKDKEGKKQEKTEWHNISTFKKLAEIVSSYLKKGSQVYIEGRIQTRKWQDKEGNDRYTTEIVADKLQMLGGIERKHHVEEPEKPKSSVKDDSFFDSMDDDLPFV